MTFRLAKCLFIIICVTTGVISQSSGTLNGANIAEIFLARANAEGKAGEPSQSFAITDIPIFCVVRFTSPTVADIKMDLVATNVPGVKAESKVVSISYTTKETEDRVNFSGKPHGNWVAGKYRVDVFISDKKVRNIEFEIKDELTEGVKPSAPKPKAPVRKIVRRATIAERYAF